VQQFTKSDKDRVIAAATAMAFGKPLVNNVLRAILAEAIVDSALPKGWQWTSGDWASYDFLHEDGTRLEVKQSAARQSWHSDQSPASKGKFDIAERKGIWIGEKWIDSPGRNAEIYVFAYHPLTDITADHREPSQWRFYVVPVTALSGAKSISLGRVQVLADSVGHAELGTCVDNLRCL
jgi:hypothetical protein